MLRVAGCGVGVVGAAEVVVGIAVGRPAPETAGEGGVVVGVNAREGADAWWVVVGMVVRWIVTGSVVEGLVAGGMAVAVGKVGTAAFDAEAVIWSHSCSWDHSLPQRFRVRRRRSFSSSWNFWLVAETSNLSVIRCKR